MQESGADGKVTFKTIFPAAYSGRWPHIHFEVYESLDAATAGGTKLRTSQLALPEETCAAVYATDGLRAERPEPGPDVAGLRQGLQRRLRRTARDHHAASVDDGYTFALNVGGWAGRTPRCADRCGSSGLHLAGTVDDVCGDAAAGESAVVDAVGVVEGQVGVELAAQAGVARVKVAREGGPPAFVEDRFVQRFDVAVGLRAAGVDAAVARAEALERVGEGGPRNSLPLSVSTRSSLQPAALSSRATRRASLLVCRAVGLPVGQITSSAQAKEE